MAFIQYSNRFFQPIADISEKYNILQSAMASSERLFRLIDTPAAIINSPHAIKPARPPKGEIEFRNVWFAYEDENWVLKDVSFHVHPGESVAIVGHTGAGKTTTTSLLTRFYDIQKGEILLDGAKIAQLDLEYLRSSFAVVLQDVFLFSGTIESNIRLGSPIPRERVVAAAEDVNLAPFLRTRTAPVARICARTRARSSNSDPGRGDVECRYGNRASDPAGDRSPDAGPHFNHHRASPVHDSALR